MIEVVNHGTIVLSSSFWGSEYDRAGKFFLSPNAGCVRLLVPAAHRAVIQEMRTARDAVVLSRGPWPAEGQAEAVELLFDDGSDNPFALHLTAASCALLPAEPEPGREWAFAAWNLKKGKPHLALQRVCHWRRVPSLPWLKPWTG